MKNIVLTFNLCLLFAYQCQAQGRGSTNSYLNIGVPQNSGIASTDFKYMN